MLEKILQAYLKWSGKGYLIPFLNGLSHLGRPSTVAFPMELMEQGLAIVLSGLNNTMAIQSNLDWIWPLWVERQVDPGGEEFIPTAINLIKTNLTCRNWTSIGLEDCPREAMIDPVGMLTLQPYGWSVFPYVRMQGRGFFPPRLLPKWQASQVLQEGTLPCVITRYDVDPALEWKSEAMALSLNGEELLGFSHTLANRSNSNLSLKFGLAIRPYNMLTMGHINSIRYMNGSGASMARTDWSCSTIPTAWWSPIATTAIRSCETCSSPGAPVSNPDRESPAAKLSGIWNYPRARFASSTPWESWEGRSPKRRPANSPASPANPTRTRSDANSPGGATCNPTDSASACPNPASRKPSWP